MILRIKAWSFKLLGTAILAGAIPICGYAATAYADSGQFTGTVTDSSGNSMQGVVVTATPTDGGSTSGSATTAADGTYTITVDAGSNVSGHIYDLTFSPPVGSGYEPKVYTSIPAIDPSLEVDLQFEPTPASSTSKILYETSSFGPIYGLNTDGTGRQDYSYDSESYQISPDGTKAAYSNGNDVFVKPNDPTQANEINITKGADFSFLNPVGQLYFTSPKWSPDGTKLMFTAQDSARQYVVTANADGSGGFHLVTSGSVHGDSWSPNGTEILLDDTGGVNNTLSIVDVNGNIQKSFSANGENWTLGSWSPDGSHILFLRGLNGYSQEFIDTINIDGSGRTDVYTFNSDQYPVEAEVEGAALWSPDSQQVLLGVAADGTMNAQYITVPTDGGSETVIRTLSSADSPEQWWGQSNPLALYPPQLNSPTSPTNADPVLSWNSETGASSYNVYQNGAFVGNTTSTTFTDHSVLASETYSYDVTAVNSSGESSPSNTVNVLYDVVAPTVNSLTWTNNPMQVGGTTTTLTATASDNVGGSGVVGGEYYIDTDPGLGHATTLNSSTLSASNVGSTLPVGVHTVGVRVEDAAGNWSTTSTTMLVVYDTNTTLGVTGKNKKDLVPSLANGDVMPGLTSTTQTDAADYGMTVQYKNGALDPSNAFSFNYCTACGTCSQKNCASTFILTATSFDWLVINGGANNNTTAQFEGTANVMVNGSTTSNPFTVEAIDGGNLSPVGNDYLILKVYAPDADPSTASPLYQSSGYMSSTNSVKIQ